MKFATIVLFSLFLLLQYVFWFGHGSVLSAWRLQTKISAQQSKNRSLQQRNQAVEADIIDLKKGDKALEEHARSELGMVKKDETFYQLIHHHDK